MKKILLSVLLGFAFCLSAFAQAPLIQSQVVTTANAPAAFGGMFENSLYPVHYLTWTASGTVSTCTVQLETSAAGVTFALMSNSAAQTCTSTGSYQFTGTVANYVRVNFTAFTGTGSVTFTLTASNPPSSLANVYFCGATSGATVNCPNTPGGATARVIGGVATLVSNGSVVTISPGFTGTATYTCVGNDVTTRANPVQVVPTSATTLTITNTTGATDVINWVCIGY